MVLPTYVIKFKVLGIAVPHNLFPSSFCILIKHRHLSKCPTHLSHSNSGWGGMAWEDFGLFTHNLPWHCHLLSLPASLCPLHRHSPHLQRHSAQPRLNIAPYTESSPILPLVNSASFLSEAITFFTFSYFSSPCTILTFHTCFSQKLETLVMKGKEKQTKSHEHILYAGYYTGSLHMLISPILRNTLRK